MNTPSINPYTPPQAKSEAVTKPKKQIFSGTALWMYAMSFVLPGVVTIICISLSRQVMPGHVIFPTLVFSLTICCGALFSGRCKMRWKVLLSILTFVLLALEVFVASVIAKLIPPPGGY